MSHSVSKSVPMIKLGTEVPDSVKDFVPMVLSRLVELDSGESCSIGAGSFFLFFFFNY